MNPSSSVLRTFELPSGSVVPFIPAAGERVRVLYGRVWLTEEGSVHDAFLGSGDEMSLEAGRGVAVIEALGPARIELVQELCGSARLPGKAAALARRSLNALRRWRVRLPSPARGAV